MDLFRLATAVRQRKLLFLLCFLLAVAGAIFIPRGGTRVVYVSMGKVLLTPPSGAEFGGQVTHVARWWFVDESTLRELATSENLLNKVIERLKLKTSWSDLRRDVSLGQASTDSGMRFSSSANLFQITVQADNPVRSKEIATVLIEEFVEYIQDLSAKEFANTRRFLEGLVAEARLKVEDTENRLLTITSSRELAADDRDVLQAQSELENERTKLREQLAVAEAEHSAVAAYLSGQNESPPWQILKEEGAMIRQLEQAVSVSRLELVDLNVIYRPDTAVVQEQQQRLSRVQAMYDAQLRQASEAVERDKAAEIAQFSTRLGTLDEQLSDLRTKKLSLKEKREVAKLERQLNVWEENRLSLIKQLYQARVLEQASRRQGAISILERPTDGYIPKEKRLPSVMRSLAVGIPFGLVFALSVVVLVEYTTSSMRLLPRIEESLDLPTLAVIPILPDDLAQRWERIKTKADQEEDEASRKVPTAR